MITVKIYKNQEEEYVGFQAEGHAEYAEEGSDIVCAAVSILINNTMNSIEQFTYDTFNGHFEQESGTVEFMFHSEPSREAALLIDSMILGLTNIEKKYGRYISLQFEEV